MKTQNEETAEGRGTPLGLAYEPARDVDALQLIGNAKLALHHHMAPADGAFDLDADDGE